MSTQNHVILREIVEIAVPDQQHAHLVHEAIGRVMRETMPGLLQRRCDALTLPDTIHRLAKVEIDLGRIALGDFERSLAGALEVALAERLEQCLRETWHGRVPRVVSHLELVTHFVHTGTLPWWADRRNREAVSESLLFLCRENPPEFLSVARAWIANRAHLRRLICASCDEVLHELLAVVHPVGVLIPLLDILCASGAWRHHAWVGALITAAGPAAFPEEILAFRVVEFVAVQVESSVEFLIEREARLARFVPASVSGLDDELQAEFRRVRSFSAPWPEFLQILEPLLPRFPQGLRLHLAEVLSKVQFAAVADLPQWLSAALSAGVLPLSALRPLVACNPPHPLHFRLQTHPGEHPLQVAVRDALSTAAGAFKGAAPANVCAGRVDSVADPFAEPEALQIENAGLVILWPFLPRFFAQLGLTYENLFRDETARQRAIAILEHLLSARREPPPEFLLPLNKILCGLMPDALFEPGPPVTEVEVAECERLLAAVIEQAPILDCMSLPGFRGTFLARAGQLTTRDGTWLLRVERQSYDVVLERFQWSFTVVRLPWMEMPILVEW